MTFLLTLHYNIKCFLLLLSSVPSTVTSVRVTERDVTSISLEWNVDVDKEWSYFLQINGGTLPLHPNESSSVLSHSVSSLHPGTEYPFSVITAFFGLNSTAYESFTVTGKVTSENIAPHVKIFPDKVYIFIIVLHANN